MRIFKFAFVGASGVAVNVALLWLMTEYLGIFYILSAAISIEASIVTNFIFNEYWTFGDKRRKDVRMLKRGIKFNTVSLVAMAVNLLILFFFTQYFGLYYLASELFGIAAGFIFNFFLNIKWTWA